LTVVGVVFLVLYLRGVVRFWREQNTRNKSTPEPIKPKARAAGVRFGGRR
jgi:hypothetical protein